MRPILLIMWTAFQSFILRHNNDDDDDDDDGDDLLQSIQQSEALHPQYLHYKFVLKKIIK